nr:hypothetical protein [Corynebacterium auriscanis]
MDKADARLLVVDCGVDAVVTHSDDCNETDKGNDRNVNGEHPR